MLIFSELHEMRIIYSHWTREALDNTCMSVHGTPYTQDTQDTQDTQIQDNDIVMDASVEPPLPTTTQMPPMPTHVQDTTTHTICAR